MKRAAIFLTLLLPVIMLLGLGYVVNGRVQAKPQLIDVGSTITIDTTWTVANSPYIINDTITVEPGVTLTIEAGVTVMFAVGMGQHMEVKGHLEVAGTAVDPVLITSIGDLPSNQWIGINVTSGSANFAHTTLRHAVTPLFIFSNAGGDVYLENSTIEENSVFPILVSSEALHRLKMNNVSFSNNVPNRIAVELNTNSGVFASLSGDVLLTPQPGLEAYELIEGVGSFTVLHVPQGITLSLAAGTVVLSDNVIMVDGRLEANGTELEPVIFEDGFGARKYYLFFAETGSASLVHTIIQHAGNVGIGLGGQSDEPVVLRDVLLANIESYPIVVEIVALHRLQMTNVTFQNNLKNRVFIDNLTDPLALSGDVTLTTQPGLEGYTFRGGLPSVEGQVVIPDGLTLTVEPGVELRFDEGAETLVVNGRLQAIGTPSQPITFTSAADSAPGQWEGIILQGSSSQLENVVVRNGRENLLIGALDPAATVQITNSNIIHSSQTPLSIRTLNLHQADLANITFANNVAGEHIVLYGEPALGGDAVLNDQPGLDAYVILDGNLSNWFVVPPTATLSINPGVTLKFNASGGDFGLRVEGELHTAGTQAEPVILTSQTDSAPGQWKGILLENGTAQLDHAEVRYATYNLTVNNTAVFSPVVLQNSQLHSAAVHGLLVLDGNVTAACSRFINNNGSGVFVSSTGQPTVQISSSALVGNGNAGLNNQNANTVDARHNWWGDVTGPAGIGPGSGDAALGNVLFDPWLEEDTCTTVSYQLYLPMVVTP